MDNLAAAPAPVETVDRTVPAGIVTPAKKGGKGAAVLAIVFALIAVGLGVWLAIVLLNPPKKDNCEVSNNSNNNGGSAEEDTSIRNDAKVRDIVKKASEVWGKAVDYAVTGLSFDDVMVLPISDSVQTSANHAYGFKENVNEYSLSRVKANLASAEQSVANAVSGYGLKKIDRPTNFSFFGLSSEKFYGNDEVFCYSSWDDFAYQFNCADKTWVDSDVKELAIALAEAHNSAKKGNQIGFIYADPASIEKNSAGTYEKILASGDDYAMMFYRKVGTDAWTYFTSGQQAPSCDLFSTAELKEVYKGEKCYDSKTNDQVDVK